MFYDLGLLDFAEEKLVKLLGLVAKGACAIRMRELRRPARRSFALLKNIVFSFSKAIIWDKNTLY